MKEYGELDRNKKSKDRVDRADMVEFKFAAPVIPEAKTQHHDSCPWSLWQCRLTE